MDIFVGLFDGDRIGDFGMSAPPTDAVGEPALALRPQVWPALYAKTWRVWGFRVSTRLGRQRATTTQYDYSVRSINRGQTT